jgi:tetratricopeptide (TPR) repeat protein
MFATVVAALVLTLGSWSPTAYVVQRGRNTIEGRVTSPERRALDNVRVFLLSDGYGQLAQTYTDGGGRYQFRGVGDGNFYVQVEPGGTPYERQSQRLEIRTLSPRVGGSAEIYRLDFVLRPEKPRSKPGETVKTTDASVFYQNVPEAARTEYEQGVKSLKKDDNVDGYNALKRAIEIFPDYYDALDLLGSEYVKIGEYEAAMIVLTHATEVNRSGWHSFYGLGISLTELNRRSEGIDALRRSVSLNPNSVNARMRLGLELGKDDKTRDEAIKALTTVTSMAGKSLPDAYIALASLYSRNKQYREAADALEAYLNAAPETAQAEAVKRKISELRQKASKSQASK